MNEYRHLGEHNMKYSPQTGLWITDASVHDAGTIECIIQLGKIIMNELLNVSFS